MEVFYIRFHEYVYNNPHGLSESGIIQSVHKAEVQSVNRFVTDIAPLCNRQHLIPCKNSGYMGCQCIIGETPALLYQMQIGHMQVVYVFLWATVLIFQGSAHQNSVGSLSKQI